MLFFNCGKHTTENTQLRFCPICEPEKNPPPPCACGGRWEMIRFKGIPLGLWRCPRCETFGARKDDMRNDARPYDSHPSDCPDMRDGTPCLDKHGHGGEHVGLTERRVVRWSNEPPAETACITCIASDLTDSHVWSRTAPPRRAGTGERDGTEEVNTLPAADTNQDNVSIGGEVGRVEYACNDRQHLLDVYEALGVAWGRDPFPVIAARKAEQNALREAFNKLLAGSASRRADLAEEQLANVDKILGRIVPDSLYEDRTEKIEYLSRNFMSAIKKTSLQEELKDLLAKLADVDEALAQIRTKPFVGRVQKIRDLHERCIADSLRAFNSAINQRTIWYEADHTSRGGVSA